MNSWQGHLLTENQSLRMCVCAHEPQSAELIQMHDQFLSLWEMTSCADTDETGHVP